MGELGGKIHVERQDPYHLVIGIEIWVTVPCTIESGENPTFHLNLALFHEGNMMKPGLYILRRLSGFNG